jgi:hypothetical protein
MRRGLKYTATVLVTLSIAVIFGLMMQFIKGNHPGVRNAVGNLSVPWLLLPYFCGLLVGRRRILLSVGIGLVASMVALFGFYAADPLVWNLRHDGLLANVLLTMVAGRRWFMLAFLSGTIFGTLSAFYTRRQLFLLTTLIVLEPFVHAIYTIVTQVQLVRGDIVVWVCEFLLGGASVFAARKINRTTSTETV